MIIDMIVSIVGVGNPRGRLENSLGNEKRAMGDGRWAMGDGRWAMAVYEEHFCLCLIKAPS
ncbi:hypothetical protein H744_2c2800 [Photobacterium gaetbulicola Gung47]|uniref:Uncharacterized protein n=1 Tax=Photobacterium gaetbulicola Gung47 TaxID=658445 RepID=A0A0C5WQL4_9GAMM|nr:hypothetical protein H744_2c2800 [Photobacterium gaetbulicola Gung47]